MKPTILCVDDEQVVRDSLKEQLRRAFGMDVRVEVAESGEVALEVLDELLEEGGEVAVVITDQIMPGMKGDELLVQVHRRSPRTVSILLSGLATPGAVDNAAHNAGLFRYLDKPWRGDELCEAVRDALELHRAGGVGGGEPA